MTSAEAGLLLELAHDILIVEECDAFLQLLTAHAAAAHVCCV